MKPYKTQDERSGSEDKGGHGTEFDPIDHPHYNVVLKMVLWGENREDIYHRLAVNGVSGAIADRLYEHARADRIRTIRGDCSRRLLIGLGLIFAAVLVFSCCWFGLRFIPRILLYACFAALGTGAWKSMDGLAGYLMAPSKAGSVSDDA